MNSVKTLFNASLLPIGIGTAQFGMNYGFSKEISQEEVNKILDLVYQFGLEQHKNILIDTAREYGNSEEKIGRYFLTHPDQKKIFRVSTKFSKISKEICGDLSTLTNFMIGSVEQSVRALGGSPISLIFLHQTDSFITDNPFFWEAIQKIKNRYQVQFGLSVYDTEPTVAILRKRSELIDVIQAPYNVLDRRFEMDLSFQQLIGGAEPSSKSIALIGRSIFLKGTLVENGLPAELEKLDEIKSVLNRLSKKTQLTVSQLLLYFVINSKIIDCALVGAGSFEQLQENLNHFSKLEDLKNIFLQIKPELDTLCETSNAPIDPRKWKSI